MSHTENETPDTVALANLRNEISKTSDVFFHTQESALATMLEEFDEGHAPLRINGTDVAPSIAIKQMPGVQTLLMNEWIEIAQRDYWIFVDGHYTLEDLQAVADRMAR